MKHILSAVLTMTAIATTSAFAADLPRSAPMPAYKAPAALASTWTGCFLGANAGAAAANASIVNANTGEAIVSSNTATGFAGGGQIGCNYQFQNGLVLGFRNMFDATSLSRSATASTGALAGFTGTTSTQWFHTALLRVGYAAMPKGWLYLQGGATWAATKQTITNVAGVQVAEATRSSNTGYAVGGGFEYMLDPKWSTFIEYNYLGFGTNTITTSTGVPLNGKADLQTVLLGVNYRFH